jgi:hypothetical protein
MIILMRSRLKKLRAYIFRTWKDEPDYSHPGLKILPPFFYEVLYYLLALAIFYQVGAYLWSLL